MPTGQERVIPEEGCWPSPRPRFASITSSITAQAQSAIEYQVKAAFLYEFAKSVNWPGDALGNGNAPLIIGVIGDDRLAAHGAEGGSRTRTPLRTTDFKSVASAIPPPRHERQK